jgi:hemolysin III
MFDLFARASQTIGMVANPVPHQRPYGRDELLADAIVHGFGLLAAMVGATYVLMQAAGTSGAKLAALLVYVLSLASMLGFSAAYNLTPASPLKWVLRRFDHSAIYVMIAATYTPLVLQLEDKVLASALALIVWGGAVIGVILKVLLPGRFDMLAIGIYLGLGWVGIFAVQAFISVLPGVTMALIAIGGIIYSAGVPFYVWERLKYQNAIWHGFVVTAAACHFIAIAWLYLA